MRSLFGEHPYSRPALGTEETVRTLTNTEIRDWFRNNQRTLVPTIVIIGDAKGTGLIAPHADALTNEDLVARDLRVLPQPQPPQGNREVVESIRRNQTALVYGFPGSVRSMEDRAALEVLSNVVSGLGGRFFDAIREKQGLAYTVRTTSVSWAKSGAVFTYTAFSPENEQKVRDALAAEFEKLRKEGVTAEELSRAREYTAGERDIALQTRQAQVLEYARTIYSGENIQSVARYGASLRAVSPDRIRAVIQKYLNPAALRTGVVRGTN
jgi:zinc protease